MREDAGVGDSELLPGVAALPSMAEADANGDGEVTKEEYLAACEAKGISPEHAEKGWAKVDADGDGVASADDVNGAKDAAKDAAAIFAAADKNGDGFLSEEEFFEEARKAGIPAEEEFFEEARKA